MSIASVTERIAQIESQISQLQSLQPGGAATAAAFAQELGRVSAGSLGGPSMAGAGGLGDVGALTDPSDPSDTALSGGSAPTTSQRAVVDEARKYLGLPYVWGGTDPSKGMDCSGLVQVVYENLGYDLPRVSADQARAGRPIGSMSEAQPGDLIAWDNSGRNKGADHIAIYIGDGKMIEAPRTGLDIRVIDVPSTPDYIRRILPDSTSTAARGVSAAAPTGPDGSAGRAALAELAAARTAFDLATRREAS